MRRIFTTAATAFLAVLILGQSFECGADEVADAREILKQAVRIMASPQYLGSKSEPLMLIVGLLAKADDLEGALNMTAGVEQHYQRIGLYGKIAETRADMNDMAGVLKVLDLIQADADYIASKNPGLPPGIYKAGVLKNITRTQARAGNIKTAQEAFALIDFERVDSRDSFTERFHLLNEIALAQARKKDAKAALKTVEALPSGYKARLMPGIARVIAENGDIDGALEIAAMVPATSSKADALLSIVEALIRNGDQKRAKEIMQTTLQFLSNPADQGGGQYPQENILIRLAAAQEMIGEGQSAATTAMTLSDKPNPSIGSPRDRALQKIAVARAEAKDKKGALETATTIQDAKVKNSTLKDIASRLAQAGNVEGSLDVIRTIQLSYWKADTIAAIAKYASVASDIKVVYPEIETIQREGDKAMALQAVVEVLARAGNVKDAIQVGSRIQTENYRSNVFNRIAIAQVRAGDIAAAFQTAAGIGGEYKYSTVREMTRVLTEAGNAKGAISWANDLPKLMPKEKVFALVGVAEGILQRQKK